MKKSEEKLARIAQLEMALRNIARLGGNLSDDVLTEKTGANDAVARGLLYVGARSVALNALDKKLDDLW